MQKGLRDLNPLCLANTVLPWLSEQKSIVPCVQPHFMHQLLQTRLQRLPFA